LEARREEQDEEAKAEGHRAVQYIYPPAPKTGARHVGDGSHDRVGDNVPQLGKKQHGSRQRWIDADHIGEEKKQIHAGSYDEQVIGYVADAVAQLDAEWQLFTPVQLIAVRLAGNSHHMFPLLKLTLPSGK